jgi:hypothetical protein
MVHWDSEGCAVSPNPKLLPKSSSSRALMDHSVNSVSTLLPLTTMSQQTAERRAVNPVQGFSLASSSTLASSSQSTSHVADMSPSFPSVNSSQRYSTSTFNFAGPVLKDMRAKLESRLGVDLASFEGLLYVTLNQQIQISKLHEEIKTLKANQLMKSSDFLIPQANSISEYLDISKQINDATFKSNLVSALTKITVTYVFKRLDNRMSDVTSLLLF